MDHLRPKYQGTYSHFTLRINYTQREAENVYHSPNINRLIKPKRRRLTGHVARMRNMYKYLLENLKGRGQLQD
jgi:hypothetical protein